MKNSYSGLTSQQATALLSQFGPNELKDTHKFAIFSVFFSQFKNILVILLLLAALVSFTLGEGIDGFFILIIVLVNAFFGLYQEYKAERSLQSLKDMTITTVRTMRDGHEIEIDNRKLVPEDIIYLEEGSKVPADAKILQSLHLQVNEASLTGESLPTDKSEGHPEQSQLFMGTVVAKGRCWAQVTNTGSNTRFGQIAQSLSGIEKNKTPMQNKMETLTKQIGVLGVFASTAVFILSFIGQKTLIESFVFAVSLAVAAVPEGLPAVMTITLGIGVERMAKKKAIIRKLNTIEALGSITVLATDKTGTLTTNKMKVKRIFVGSKEYSTSNPPQTSNRFFSLMLLNSTLCSTASLVYKVDHGTFDVLGDTTEGAALVLAKNLGLDPDSIRSQWTTIKDIPFNTQTKRMSVVVKDDHRHTYTFSKGAPEFILSICDRAAWGPSVKAITPAIRSKIEAQFQSYAKKGMRVLAFSYKSGSASDIESEQIFLGFIGIADPARPEVKAAVSHARSAGIKVIMITGDNQLTAKAIGIETGIIIEGEDILTGNQLDDFTDDQLAQILPKVKIYARTTPEHKHRLVRLLQQAGEIVAVTGDGVNDTLALKQADVGVAMGQTGTDVAKETADMIITDDNFATLVNAVEEGRNIFNHIKNSVRFLLACNLGEVVYLLSAVIFKLPLITPLQILYINLVTDGLPAISFAFAPSDNNVMSQKPNKMQKILTNSDLGYITFTGVLTGFAGILASFTGNSTIIFTAITLIQPLILLDTWLPYRPILAHLHHLLHPIFLSAAMLPLVLHPILLFTPFFNLVLQTQPLSISQVSFSLLPPVAAFILLQTRFLLPLRK